MRWVLGGGALLGFAAACTSFTTSGAPAADDAGAPDASAPLEAAAPVDAGRFCAHTDAAFCIDFDGPPVGAFVLQNGAVSTDDQEGNGVLAERPSLTGGELVSTLPSANTTDVRVAARQFLLPGTGDVVVEADMMIDPIAPAVTAGDTNIGFLSLVFGRTNPYGELIAGVIYGPPHPVGLIVRTPTDLQSSVAGDYALTYGERFHVVMKAGAAGDASAPIAFDLAMGESGTFSVPGLTRSPQPSGSTTTLILGLGKYQHSELPYGMTVHIDNVTVNPL